MDQDKGKIVQLLISFSYKILTFLGQPISYEEIQRLNIQEKELFLKARASRNYTYIEIALFRLLMLWKTLKEIIASDVEWKF